MNFTGKLNVGVAKVRKQMKNGIDNCKLDGQIVEQQKKIKLLTKEIGTLALLQLEAGDEMCPEIMERYAVIQKAKEMIVALEEEKKRTTIICPNCGVKTSIDMKYCGACGKSLREI